MVSEKGKAPRARNKTVVLTPELAGEVRARVNLSADSEFGGSAHYDDSGGGATGGASQDLSSDALTDGGRRPSKPFSPPPRPENFGPPATQRGHSFGGAGADADSSLRGSSAWGTDIEQDSSASSDEPLRQRWVSPPPESSLVSSIEALADELSPAEESLLGVSPDSPSFEHPVRSSVGSDVGTPVVGPASLSQPGTNQVDQALLVGFLVSFDEDPYGQAFELRQGRTIVSSDLPRGGGRILLIEHETVASMHAVIKAEADGTVILLDQLSEFGTFVAKKDGQELELSGDRIYIESGDMVRFGERLFKVCLLG